MGMFRKKPVVIEARRLSDDSTRHDLLGWINEGQRATGREPAQLTQHGLIVPTLEGQHVAIPGDWIIRGVAGEFYPCKPEIFAATYESAE